MELLKMEQCVNNLKITSTSGLPLAPCPQCPRVQSLHTCTAVGLNCSLNIHYVLHVLTGLYFWNCTTEMQSNHRAHFDMIIPEQHFWEAMLRRTSVHFGDAILDWIAFEDTTLRRKTRKSPRCNSAACCFRRAARKLNQKFSFTTLILQLD